MQLILVFTNSVLEQIYYFIKEFRSFPHHPSNMVAIFKLIPLIFLFFIYYIKCDYYSSVQSLIHLLNAERMTVSALENHFMVIESHNQKFKK